MKQFANSELRQSWIRDKGMQVLQFWSDAHRETSVDVFVTEPFAFDDEYTRALIRPLHDKLRKARAVLWVRCRRRARSQNLTRRPPTAHRRRHR